MAIVEMKHVDMLALERDRQSLLAAIQKLGCFQLTPSDTEDVTFNKPPAMGELPELDETITRVGWAIGKLNRYDTEKKRLMADRPTIDTLQADALMESQADLMHVVETLEALEREAGELRGQTARIDAQRELLLPWQSLPMPLDTLKDTRNTVTALGTVQKTAIDQWLADGTLGDLCSVQTVSTERELAYIHVLCHREAWEQVLATLRGGNFTALNLPHVQQSAGEMLGALADEQRDVEESQRGVIARISALASRLNDLRKLYDILTSRRARTAAANSLSVSEKTFFLQGWVPAPMTETIEKRLTAVAPTVALSFYDPADGEESPVLLHNPAAFTPFESVVTGFSLPAPTSFDPTVILTPFFINFMGMMISDAGYGLMMAIIIPILIKVLKPAAGTRKMMWLLMAGGVATVFWGALYNTWFGFAPLPLLFDPMNNALPVMGVCIGLGAVHLFTGLGVAAYLNIRRGKPWDAVADQLSWFMLVVGLALMIFLPDIGKWIALTGAGIILVTAGRAKSKNPFKRLLSGLGALYGATSWISDLLSYMRLFGMGLATGVIGMVINILVGMVVSSGPIGMVIGSLLFVGGHLFNAGINTLGAYVHSCRLQYIEFFGKFFEDGGKPFVPLMETTRYVYIRDAERPAV